MKLSLHDTVSSQYPLCGPPRTILLEVVNSRRIRGYTHPRSAFTVCCPIEIAVFPLDSSPRVLRVLADSICMYTCRLRSLAHHSIKFRFYHPHTCHSQIYPVRVAENAHTHVQDTRHSSSTPFRRRHRAHRPGRRAYVKDCSHKFAEHSREGTLEERR